MGFATGLVKQRAEDLLGGPGHWFLPLPKSPRFPCAPCPRSGFQGSVDREGEGTEIKEGRLLSLEVGVLGESGIHDLGMRSVHLITLVW